MIGEIGRNLCIRLQEHKHAVINGDSKNGIATHVMEDDHRIQWEEAQVVASEPQLTRRKIKEFLHIRKTSNSMNLDKGLQLDHIC